METVRISIILLLAVIVACSGNDREAPTHARNPHASSIVEFELVGTTFADDEQFYFGPAEFLNYDDAPGRAPLAGNSSLGNGHLHLLYAGDEYAGKTNTHLLLSDGGSPLSYRVSAGTFSADTVYLELHYSYENSSDTLLEYVDGVVRMPFKVVTEAAQGGCYLQKIVTPPFGGEPIDTVENRSLRLDLNNLLM